MCKWYIISKVMQCKVMQGHATLRKAMQCPARSSIVMQVQSHVIMQGKSHTSSVNFTLLLRRFACTQAFSGSRRGVVVYHRWSPEYKLVLFMLFLSETILIRRTLQKSNFLQFRAINEREGAWSADSD